MGYVRKQAIERISMSKSLEKVVGEGTGAKTVMSIKKERDEDLYQLLNLMLLELRTHSPFLGVLASELWIAGPADNVPTIGVSPKGVISYSEEFMSGLTPGERIACIVHEALHVALEYWDIFDFKKHNMKIANWAHDYTINDIIVKSIVGMTITRKSGKVDDLGIRLPANTLWDKKFEGWTTEAVYAHLMEEVVRKKDEIINRMKMAGGAASDPKEEEIKKELRQSVIAGKKVIDFKINEIMEKSGIKDPIAQANREFMSALKDSQGISIDHTGSFSPDVSHLGNIEDLDDQNNQIDPQKMEEYLKKRDNLKENCLKAFSDYMEREEKRIRGEVFQTPDGTTRPEHLKKLAEDLDNLSDDYTNDVTDPGQDNSQSQPDQNTSPQDQKSDQNKDQGKDQSADGNNQPDNAGQQPDASGNDNQGNDSQPGQDGQGEQPGSDPGGKGENGQDGPDGSPSSGNSNESHDNSSSGQPQPGDGQGSPGDQQGDPSQEGQPSGDPSSGGPSQGQGQGGDSSPSQGDMPDMDGNGGVSKEQASQDITDALKGAQDEINKALNGQSNSSGLDKNMASGDEMSNQGAFEEAMREMAKEMGAGKFDGDVDYDCSGIEGNPYTKETPKETKERHKQSMSRAINEDIQQGGKGIGKLPGWAQTAIKDIINPPMRFNQKIKRFIGNMGPQDKRSFAMRNKRNSFQPLTMVRPGAKKGSAKIYVLLDTSGSMMCGEDMDNLRGALGLIKRLAESQKMDVEVVQVDTEVTRILTTEQALEEIRKRSFILEGIGGSDFRPGFDYIWQEMETHNPGKGNAIVVFTDGGIVVPEKPPKHIRQQVLWVTNEGQRPPTSEWGEHVHMNSPSP